MTFMLRRKSTASHPTSQALVFALIVECSCVAFVRVRVRILVCGGIGCGLGGNGGGLAGNRMGERRTTALFDSRSIPLLQDVSFACMRVRMRIHLHERVNITRNKSAGEW
jgi:hypothetical protein